MVPVERPVLAALVDFLIRWRMLLLAAMLGVTLLAWPVAARLQFDQTIESLYAVNDPFLLDYLESKRLFGGDEFVIVAWPAAGLFQPGTMELSPQAEADIRRFAGQLSRVPGVRPESTQDLSNALRFRYRREKVLELVAGGLVSDDRRITAVVLRLMPANVASVPRGETFARIRDLAAAHDPPAHVVGEPVQIHDMFRYVEEDGQLLFRFSLGLLAAVILVLFRSIRWVLLPLLVVVSVITWTGALFVLSGARLSMVSSMLNSLVTIIGIATVTHVTVRFRELRGTHPRLEALRETLIQLLPAVFWTCATTSCGFAALLSSQITPVRSFGLMMSAATLLVLVAAAAALPGGILLGQRGTDPHSAPAESRLVSALGKLTRWVDAHPRPIIAGAVGLFLLAGAGFHRLDVETDFSRNFRSDTPIVQSLEFVETRLGGAGTWEVNFPMSRSLEEEDVVRVEALADALREIAADSDGRFTKVVSLSDGLKLVPRFPIFLNTIRKRLEVLRHFQSEFEQSLYNAEAGRMRIMLRARERQASQAKLELMSDVERAAQAHFPQAKATGTFVLLAHLIESLLRDQLVSFALAAAGIVAMMSIAFRSLRIGLASLVPNLFPIVLVVGGMGWVGVPVNIGTAMIASVSMGLTVDSSIHYFSGYRRARSGGLTRADALRRTHQSVGLALVLANVALVVGFTVLALSHFIPLIYFGILVSLAMLGGLSGNLFLLPLLLRWLDPDGRP